VSKPENEACTPLKVIPIVARYRQGLARKQSRRLTSVTHNGIPQVGPQGNPARYVVFENPSNVSGEVSEASIGKTERWRSRRNCEDRPSVAHKAGPKLGEEAPLLPSDARSHAKQSLRDTTTFLVACPFSGIRKEIDLGIKANPAVKIYAQVYSQPRIIHATAPAAHAIALDVQKRVVASNLPFRWIFV
jgi:hypothetical protein